MVPGMSGLVLMTIAKIILSPSAHTERLEPVPEHTPPVTSSHLARLAGITPASAALLELTNSEISSGLDAISADATLSAQATQSREDLRAAARARLQAQSAYMLVPSEENQLALLAAHTAFQEASLRARELAQSVRSAMIGTRADASEVLIQGLTGAIKFGLPVEFGVVALDARTARDFKLGLAEEASETNESSGARQTSFGRSATRTSLPSAVAEAREALQSRLPEIDSIFAGR